MKKITSLLLVCALLAFALTGCSKDAEPAEAVVETGNFAPETTAEVATTIEATVEPEPTLPEAVDIPTETEDEAEIVEATPEATAEPEITPEPAVSEETLSAYTFQTLADNSFGFVFTHPSNWINHPGKHTVCFREPVEEGDYPARVAITKKMLAHVPKSERVLSQFQALGQTIYAQYDPATFEWGTLRNDAKFLGKTAFEIGYLAYDGDVEVQGYMICTAVEHSIYVFHFTSAYEDYADMWNLVTLMRDSIQLVD